MTAEVILENVRRAGGQVWAEEGKLKYRLPATEAALLKVLKEAKPELLDFLSSHSAIPYTVPCHTVGWLVNGKRVTVFPHCPRCASYALYRKDNIGDYECLTCGLLEIDESTARRLV